MRRQVCSGIWAWLLCAMLSTAVVAAPPPATSVDQAIEQALDLLERGEHRVLVQQLLYPPDLQRMLKDDSLDEIAQGFAADAAETLQQALQQIRGQVPDSDDGARVEFTLDPPAGIHTRIRFGQLDGRWYILN